MTFAALLFGCACQQQHGPGIATLLERDNAKFGRVLAHAEPLRLQILVSEVRSDGRGQAYLARSGFRVDAEYFYPASTVKLCAIVAAAQLIEAAAARTGLPVTFDTPLVIHPLRPGDAVESRDDTNLDSGTLTTGHEIRKIGLVSDNAAFNRLYDLVGPQQLNQAMHDAGLSSVSITHRLSVARTPDENRRAPRVDLVTSRGVFTIPSRAWDRVATAPSIPGLHIGAGYIRADQLINEPMDFSFRNRIALRDLQDLLVLLVRPDVDIALPPLALSKEHRSAILDALTTYPADSSNPIYPRDAYPNDWGKPLLPGVLRVVDAPSVRYVNKVGQAYGFTIDNAYIENTRTGRAVFVTVAIYTNADGILNDDAYQYAEVAQPFMADLGEVVSRAYLCEPARGNR